MNPEFGFSSGTARFKLGWIEEFIGFNRVQRRPIADHFNLGNSKKKKKELNGIKKEMMLRLPCPWEEDSIDPFEWYFEGRKPRPCEARKSRRNPNSAVSWKPTDWCPAVETAARTQTPIRDSIGPGEWRREREADDTRSAQWSRTSTRKCRAHTPSSRPMLKVTRVLHSPINHLSRIHDY